MYIVTLCVGYDKITLKFEDKEEAASFMADAIDRMSAGNIKLEKVDDEKSPE